VSDELGAVNIEANIRAYLGDRTPTARYTSVLLLLRPFPDLA
jgi:hypothetical protein